ncbi:MAG: type II secretion system F family protein [Clostridia bacterium]
MGLFRYRGMLKNGSYINSKIEAKDRAEALAKIKKSKIIPIEVKKIKEPRKILNNEQLSMLGNIEITNERGKRKVRKKNLKPGDIDMAKLFSIVKPKDVLVFTNNLYILKKSNFNNIQALQSLYNGTENLIIKDIIEDVLIGVESGQKMWETMQYYPKVFPAMYVNFVRVGEESGDLGTALLQARDYVESSASLKKKLKGILVPKVIQFVLMMGGMFAALLFGAPMIENVYASMGSKAELPAFTQQMIGWAKWMVKYWYVVAAIIGAIVGSIALLVSTPKGKYAKDKFILKIPVSGKLIINLTTFKLFQAMLLNLKNGLRIQEAIDVAKSITNNYYFLSILELSKAQLLSGGSWIKPFEESGLFPPMAIEMLNIGMETDIIEMMEKVNEYIDMEINESIDRVVKVLPDLTYLVIGIVLIVFMLAVMVPLMDLYMGGFMYDTTE